MRKRIFTSTVAALALFVVVGLVAALAPSITSLNLARAHSGDASLTALTVTATADGTAQTLSPTFSSTVTDYTVNVANSVAQVTVLGTPDGDGIVTYYDTDADSGTDGHQVDLPAAGRKLINVLVTHRESVLFPELPPFPTMQIYTVLVIREGSVETDKAALMALYNSTAGATRWDTKTNWGTDEPLDTWYGVYTNANDRVHALALGRNNLRGTLPDALGNLDRMLQLVLPGNELSGPIPASLGDLTYMYDLSLWGNKLTGEIPASLGDLASLQKLYLGGNKLSGTIPDSLGNLTNLRELLLWGNDFERRLPTSLGNLTKLTDLDISSNTLTGPIPDLSRLTRLQKLYLQDNSLSGSIPTTLGSLTNLQELDLNINALEGTIPTTLGNLTNLTRLILNTNELTGTIPTTLGSLTSLQQLRLYNNKLSGEIPEELGSLASLRELYFFNNLLSGSIPTTLGNLTNLEYLYLYDNQLTGSIPEELGNLTNLTGLALHINELSGEIPEELGSLTNLQILALYANELSGEIPTTLGNLTNLKQLELSRNQLRGEIPDLSRLNSLEELNISLNRLTGTIPDWLGGLTTLTGLSLWGNQLTGEIPDALGNLSLLEQLVLHENHLSGDFPAALGNLKNLKLARFAINTDAEGNPSLTGCVPLGLRYLLVAEDFMIAGGRFTDAPAHDFIPVDANNDFDFDDFDDTPGLNLPFCMVHEMSLYDLTIPPPPALPLQQYYFAVLDPLWDAATAAYTTSVENSRESIKVNVDLAPGVSDPVSIRKGTSSYGNDADVPLAVGSNEITVTVTPTDGTPTLTYSVTLFRSGVDQETLMALYNGVGGASWTDKTNWGSTTAPLDEWFGVEADSNGSVTELELPGNILSGTLPAALGTLTSLTTLNLGGNQVRGAIPDLSALTSLTTLKLGDNQLSGTIPDWLSSLTGLQDLSLRDNQLTGTIPGELGGLTQLDLLYLDDNQLSGPIPAALGGLSGLQATRFAGNTLTGCVPDGLRYLVTSPVFDSLPAHDFIAVDANDDGDTTDDGDTPGLELPFCTVERVTLSPVTLVLPVLPGDPLIFVAAHDVTSVTVTATLYDSSDTVSIMKGTDTYMNGDSVPLEVGTNVITIEVTPADNTPTQTLTATVTRAPNAPPTFSDGLTTTRGVEENTATGEDIGAPVAATDDDNDTLTYSLDTTSAASFDISSTTGQLQTKAALDFEDKSSYTVTVSVSDSKDANSDVDDVTDDTITVTIQVTNVNEAPVFTPIEPVLYDVDENTIAGEDIGAPVAATDDDNDTLTYSLDDSSRATFDIVATTGQLQTKAALDYETGTISYTVTVIATDPPGEDDTIDVTITVNNVEEPGTVTLSSTQPVVGTSLTATLTDPDGNPTNIKWEWDYSRNGDWSPHSIITEATTTSSVVTPVFFAEGRFLRATASYDDNESAGKSAMAVFANRVQPAPVEPNEPPEFLTDNTLRNVDENTVAGVNIGEPVAATDPEGDTLTYSLDAAGAASFDIVASSGQLQTKAALDFETPANYFITVTAVDPSGADDTITVTITVNNVDEPGTVTLSSTQPVEEIRLTATLDDPDDVSGSATWSWARSPNGTSSWTLISGATSASYTPVLDDVDRYLRATASYDDDESAGKSAQRVSANRVQPAPVVRNEPPQFPSNTAARDVDENTVAGRDIGEPVTATDPEGDTLTYSLDVDSAASFDIVATTGQLQTKAALDFETPANYFIRVTATDTAGGTDTITVTITVNNIDEAGTVTLSSLQPVEEIRLTATLDDPDDVSGSVTWSWESSPNGSSWTPISGATSASYTPVPADVDRYLRATASYTDEEGSGKSAQVVSANRVQPAPLPPNEPPQFPSNTTLRNVDENTSAGEDIGPPVTATDPEGDTLTYSLDADGAASFDIIATTGQLRTKAALDHEITATYGVTVTATDTAGATDTITVTIDVNNIDEAGTVTLSSLQPIEGTPLTATLDDPDDVSGSATWLWAGSPNGSSSWTPISGETSASYTPVAADVGDYLRATASYDDGEGSGKSAQAISANAVQVAPGRNAPVFKEGANTTRTILENTPAGRNIGAPVSATDADNDALAYSLGGRDRAGFDLDTTSGQLRTKAPLTGIHRTRYTVIVSVSDSKDDEGNPEADPQTDATTEVTILVTEVNEAPVFPSATATRTIPENTTAGVNIGAPVAATDPDNDALTYSLDVDGAASFNIGSTDGQLQTKAPLNRASRSSYTVIVSVSDSKDDLGQPDTAIDATTEVTINITTITTTTTTTRPSGGSSGGGRSRATPTPTPTPSPTPMATPTPTGPQFSGQIAAEPSVTATVVPEGTTLGLNGGGDQPGGVYVNFPPTAVALPVHVSVSVSNTAPDDVEAPSGTTLLPLTIDITSDTPLILGEPITIEINPTPEQLAAAGGDLNNLAVGVVTPHGVVVLPTQVMHGRLVVTIDHLSTFVLLAITDPGPMLTQPPMGDASSMGPLLQWTQPPSTTWFQVQVIPFNEDGPGINLVIGDGALVQAAQYQVLGPNFGSADPNYVMLPGMTYLWRVRTSTVLTNPTEADWSAWAASSFKTPLASSSTITRVAPPFFGEVRTLTPTLTWANSNAAVFYYEVQLSRDYEFGPNAFLYSEYVHGGASTPPNSYVVPAAYPLEAGEFYYWRVRPRIQGDGDPLPWSRTYVFQAPG